MRLLTIGILLLMTATVFGQQSSAAKAVAAKNGDAVVAVKISVKMRVSGDGQTSNEEQKNEIIGTVISPDGIILVPLSATDPTDIISRAMGDNEESNFKMNVDVVELKVRTPEGLEIPGKVILRDQDMDLAFIKLNKKPDHPMVYVDINKNSTVGLLDDVIVMGRTNPSIYRSLCVDCEKVEVMVKKPQPFYILTHSGSASNLGSPIFDFSGKFVGIMVLRATTQLRGSKGNSGPHAIVRPAAVIAKSAGALLKGSTGSTTVKIGKISPSKNVTKTITGKTIFIPGTKKAATPVKKKAAANVKPIAGKTPAKKPAAKKVEKTKKMEIVPVKKTN
ncbi:MAG: trypsin-like peptidase domain-containing protein [bacterium]